MQSLISLTFDDGLRCQFERALPILDQHSLSATFFLVANTEPILIDGYEHPDWSKTDWNKKDVQLLESMLERGHEIGSHSVHHQRQFLKRDPKLETRQSKQWMEERLGTEVSSFCYPFVTLNTPSRGPSSKRDTDKHDGEQMQPTILYENRSIDSR